MTHLRIVVLLALVAVLDSTAMAEDYYASPRRTRFGNGSRSRPFDLATALKANNVIGPGDTLWLLEGVYRGSFVSTLAGNPGRPVVIRNEPGARVTIDVCTRSFRNRNVPTGLTVQGDWCVLQGFEVLCSNTKRTTELPGSHPADIGRGAVTCHASHVKFINLIVHDLGNGFGFWSEGEGGEIYGCVVYNNGWQGPDRPHGHGIYAQNENGTKFLLDNIVFNQFSHGIHCFGSSKAKLNNFHLEGNIAFNNALDIRVGGEVRVRNALVSNNVLYNTRASIVLRLGYTWGPSNSDAVVADNYFGGTVWIKGFDHLTYVRNRLVGTYNIMTVLAHDRQDVSTYKWNHNSYFRMGTKYAAFVAPAGVGGFPEWRGWTGLDRQSIFRQFPTTTKSLPRRSNFVFVRPNRYEKGRANVAILNWTEADEVIVPLEGVLTEGQRYRVVSAQDFFGNPIVRGVYNGESIRIPMRPTVAVPRIGLESQPMPTTEPIFGAYVVLPQ